MKIDTFGQVLITEEEAFDALYSGRLKDLKGVYIDNNTSIDRYNQSVLSNADSIPELKQLEDLGITIEQFDKYNQLEWMMPKNYCPDLIENLYAKCVSEQQRNRVTIELELFAKHKMVDLLYYLSYLVDVMRKNKIVWGVGRGSSVASYVLYLIGVHKIDSIKYDLDIHEFLKEK